MGGTPVIVNHTTFLTNVATQNRTGGSIGADCKRASAQRCPYVTAY